jgi:peptidoglycan lytic transglycosylase B
VVGSTGNYLHKGHWIYGLPWGFEVAIPQNFDMMTSRGSFAEWTKRGVKRVDGKFFPREGDGILFFPAGAKGPAFMVTENYAVLKEYNNPDAYAMRSGISPTGSRAAPRSRPPGLETTGRSPATLVSRCRKNSLPSDTKSPISKGT